MTWKLPSFAKSASNPPGAQFKNLRSDEVFARLAETIKERSSGKRVFYAPNVGNWGDGLIHEGTVQFLRQNGIAYTQIPRSKFVQIRRSLDGTGLRLENTLLISGGGGSFCEAWSGSRDFLNANTLMFDHTVLMPSTYELPPLDIEPERLTYFSRDDRTSKMNNPDSIFCHDMAFYLQFDPLDVEPVIEEGNFFRSDKERHERAKVPSGNMDLSALGNHLQPAQPLFQILASHRRINTDRMHIAIASSMLGREVALYPGSYFKSTEVYRSSIKANYPRTTLASWP